MRIFVIERNHTIVYAGTSPIEAKNRLHGNETIDVWGNGVWIGDLGSGGEWKFKTRHHPDNKKESR